MISATHTPDLLRVSFVERERENERTEVICYIRVVNGKIEVNYSHHASLGRSSRNGPWAEAMKHRITLEASMIARIHYMVFHEIWNVFGGPVRILPSNEGDLDSNLENIQW